jgi:DNA-binding protein Fis
MSKQSLLDQVNKNISNLINELKGDIDSKVYNEIIIELEMYEIFIELINKHLK